MPVNTVDTDLLLNLFEQMSRIRSFEERTAELRQSGDVVGSVHLCNGQEAICVGTVSALELDRDIVFPTYRGHGWTLACGATLEEMFAELLGRESGLNGGRGGSAYLFAPAYGMYGENSIVGAGTVIASGAALAAKFDGSGRITVPVIGDGAMNQGSVHEALNFASVNHLPVLFVVENNHWSELTPISAMTANERLYTRARPYNIPSARIDGNDVLAVHATMREVVERIRSGQGPILIEAVTDRIVGHYIGDVQTYRVAGEMDRLLEAEPIARARRSLLENGVTAEAIDAASDRARRETLDACKRALSSPLADTSTVWDHLYA